MVTEHNKMKRLFKQKILIKIQLHYKKKEESIGLIIWRYCEASRV